MTRCWREDWSPAQVSGWLRAVPGFRVSHEWIYRHGLVRQYFPKKSDFSKIRAADLRRLMGRHNHRPRKTLNFRTPHQVFFKTKEIAFTT